MALLPILGELGLVLYDLEIARGTGRISVTVDRDGAVGVPGKGVTIEETAQVTRKFLYLLETTDLVSFAWSLEVSSPGIERSLRSLRHFEYALGQRCRVVLAEPVEGQIVLDGIVQSVSADGEVEIQVGGRVLTFSVHQVRRGRTVFDFGVSAPPGSKKKAAKAPAKTSGSPAKQDDDESHSGEME